MSKNGTEALPVFRERSGGARGFYGVVGKPSWISGSGREASRMSASGRETLPDVKEWSRGPRRFEGEVGRPSRMSGSGRDALPDDREWSGGLGDMRE